LTLLDTNTIIFYLRGVAPVVARIQASSPREIALPSVVAYELEYGALKRGSPRRRTVISRLLAGIAQVPFDGPAAVDATRIRIELENTGHVIGPIDLLIAGTALSRNAVLVTNNTKAFSRVKGLRLADWTG
jgi:tRNA(fMet)-specific endonuclease VapC